MSIELGRSQSVAARACTIDPRALGLFLIEGIVLVVLGLLAIIIPSIATIAVTIFLGVAVPDQRGRRLWSPRSGRGTLPGSGGRCSEPRSAIAAGIVSLAWPSAAPSR